jgi:hypothetical protein
MYVNNLLALNHSCFQLFDQRKGGNRPPIESSPPPFSTESFRDSNVCIVGEME